MTTASPTHEQMLRMVYAAAYDNLDRHPEFDGWPRPTHPGLIRAGVDSATKPWPGFADVRRVTRDEWVQARLDAVRAGSEAPAMRLGGQP